MGIEISEQFVEAKTAGRVCEDMIVTTADFVAVIDGASDLTGAMFDGKAGGRFAAEVLAVAISELEPTATARDFADAMTSKLNTAVARSVGHLTDDVRWPAASVACASAHRREVWRVGDCHVVIGGVHHPGGKRVDDAAYGFRAAVNASLINKGLPISEVLANDPGAAAARPLLNNQQHLANVVGPWGWGCINGRPIPDQFVESLPIPAGRVHVVISSDGYPLALPTLAESEAHLTEMMQRDPAAIAEMWAIGKSLKPGANAPDDRAFISFVVQSS